MQLSEKEIDKLQLMTLGMIAERRMARGLRLNYPEAVAYLSWMGWEAAREGKTPAEVKHTIGQSLRKEQVMKDVDRMVPLLEIEAVFRDGIHLIIVPHPIQ